MLHCTIITITLQLLTAMIFAANLHLSQPVLTFFLTLFLLQIDDEHF
jgi:hypothetical protein